MSPDDDVDTAIGEPSENCLSFGIGLKPREGPKVDREGRIALLEGLHVLFDQQRGGCNQRHLFLILDCFERCPDRNFGLAKAHISRD